jgi:DNA polymerase-4
MDCFYVAVERLTHPEWNNTPVIVAGLGARGVVSSASYEARAFGVHSAMPTARARQKCPHGVFVQPQMEAYSKASRQVMNVLADFSPQVEQISVDEAFLEMTGSEGLFGPLPGAAEKIQSTLMKELGLSASIGIAGNKFLAKMASDEKKPGGITWIQEDSVQTYLDSLPVGRLWGVGKKAEAEFHRHGYTTVGQVREAGIALLSEAFGSRFATHIYALSCGQDERDVDGIGREEKSISHERTFATDIHEFEKLEQALLDLCDRVARRARKEGLSGRTITLVWRDPDFSRHSRSRTGEPAWDSPTLFAVARRLLLEMLSVFPTKKVPRKIRLLGVRLSQLETGEKQLDLFSQVKEVSALDRVMDKVRDRFGDGALQRGRLVKPPSKPLGEN